MTGLLRRRRWSLAWLLGIVLLGVALGVLAIGALAGLTVLPGRDVPRPPGGLSPFAKERLEARPFVMPDRCPECGAVPARPTT